MFAGVAKGQQVTLVVIFSTPLFLPAGAVLVVYKPKNENAALTLRKLSIYAAPNVL